jgi:hypothetical protein
VDANARRNSHCTPTMHTICGADIKVESANASDPLAVLEALMKQVDAIYKATKKK